MSFRFLSRQSFLRVKSRSNPQFLLAVHWWTPNFPIFPTFLLVILAIHPLSTQVPHHHPDHQRWGSHPTGGHGDMPGVLRLGEDGVHIMVGPKDRWFSSWFCPVVFYGEELGYWVYCTQEWMVYKCYHYTIFKQAPKLAEVPEVWFLDPLIFGIPIMGTYLMYLNTRCLTMAHMVLFILGDPKIIEHWWFSTGQQLLGVPQFWETQPHDLWAKTWVCNMRLPVAPHMTGQFGIFWNVKPTIFGGLIASNSTCQWSDQWLSCN